MMQTWIVILILCAFLVPGTLYSEEKTAPFSSQENDGKGTSASLEQIGAFSIRQNAQKVVKALKQQGKEAFLRKDTAKNKKILYRVFVRKDDKLPEDAGMRDGVTQESYQETARIKEPDQARGEQTGAEQLSGDIPDDKSQKPVALLKFFQDEGEAKKFSEELEAQGYATTIQRKMGSNNLMVFSVYAEYRAVTAKSVVSAGADRTVIPSQTLPPVEPAVTGENVSTEAGRSGESGSASEMQSDIPHQQPSIGKQPAAEKIPVKELAGTAEEGSPPAGTSHEIPAGRLAVEAEPIGTVKGRPTEEVFGRRGGYIHPFLSVTEYYTDNVFFSNRNEKSDFITVISPGIWLTVPHVYEKLLHIDTSNLSPGGFSLSRFSPETFRRYQTYLYYNADIELFSKYSSENTVNHKAEGLFQYNLRGGLSIELVDQFIASHDIRGTGISSKLDKYHSNLANAIVTYEATERLKFRVDYTNFLVNYAASRNDFRDRDDNAFSGYIFYKFRPKTALFVEYEFLDVRYRADSAYDSREHHYFGGIEWEITAKSKGNMKAGYGVKDFTDSDIPTSKDFVLEAQIDHKFTPKTSLILKASRRTNETNISGTDFVLSNAVEVEYLQRITGKITADAKFSYRNDKYKGDIMHDGITGTLDDDYYFGAFALQYKFREWLELDLGYIYSQRDSSFSDFDYVSNTIFMRITGSL